MPLLLRMLSLTVDTAIPMAVLKHVSGYAELWPMAEGLAQWTLRFPSTQVLIVLSKCMVQASPRLCQFE